MELQQELARQRRLLTSNQTLSWVRGSGGPQMLLAAPSQMQAAGSAGEIAQGVRFGVLHTLPPCEESGRSFWRAGCLRG